MNENTVTCFGELLLRLSPPGRHLLAQAQSLELVVGGAEANVASALAALGHEVRFASVVADNPLGERALAALRGCGVDVRHIARAAGRMGLYFLESGAGPRPSAITYDRTGSAFASAAPESLDFAGALAGARLLHCGGITLALGPGGVALARAAQAAARAAGVPVCFDGNYRAQLWAAWDSDPATILRELVADATILIGNHRDISLLLGRDFSGEGDAFAAGVIDGWLGGDDLAVMAQRGLMLAALKHTIPGDMCPVNRAMLDGFSAGAGDVRR